MKVQLVICLLLVTGTGAAQTTVQQARTMKDKAVNMMDNGDPDGAIKLLEQAKKIEPNTYRYDYEIGYAYYIKQDLKMALKIYKEVVKYDDANDQCYQMLGNLFDMNGEPAQAIKAYDKGLKKFPGSGRLYLEKGNVYWNQKKYDEALPNYEEGIEQDPTFPSNYYRATLLYLDSDAKVWGMIYGELFVNLERNSKRTQEISKRLYDTYKSQIKFRSPDTASVSFSGNNIISVNDIKDGLRLPYGMAAYEPALLLSVGRDTALNINSIDSIRQRFLSNYIALKTPEKYPNILFDYQAKVRDAGHFSAYNHWILMKGDEQGYNLWKAKNEKSSAEFMAWYMENGLRLSATEKFFRRQYNR